jgi:two-component sensor histidine kinase
MAPLVDAHQGTIYHFAAGEGQPALKLLSSYAQGGTARVQETILPSQGLLGQCALDKKRIVITDVAPDFVSICTSLGEARRVNIVVLPVLFEGQTKAVIELASLRPLTVLNITFLEQLTPHLGAVFNTIEATMRTEGTLENRVAARTSELAESRARLRHAADLAKLTYFDLDYVHNRIQTAENFASIMGFALPEAIDGEDPLAVGGILLREHVVPSDRDRFVAETDQLEVGVIARRNIAFLAMTGENGGSRASGTWKAVLTAGRCELSPPTRSARGTDPATFATDLTDRLHGLSASQDLFIKCDWRGIDIHDLVHAQLGHFRDPIGKRILVEGSAGRLTAAAAQAVGMALHELATNAAKYGSLSTGEGRARISWNISKGTEPLFTMQWAEEHGPKVSAPTRKGFGSLIMGPVLESALGGKVEIDFRESGLIWKLSALVSDGLETRVAVV